MNDKDNGKPDIFSEFDNIRMIYEAVPVGIVIVDSDTRIISANNAVIEMMGGRDLIGIGKRFGDGLRCIGSLLDGCGYGEACFLCVIRGTIMKSLETGLTYNDLILQHEFMENEQEISPWFKMSFVPLTINDEKYVMITVDDITKLKVIN